MPPALQIATPPLKYHCIHILGLPRRDYVGSPYNECARALPRAGFLMFPPPSENLIMLRAALARRLCGTRLLSSAAGPHRVSSRSLPGLVPSLRDFMQPSEASKIGEANPAPYIDPQLLMGGGRRVYLETYGCQMNVADTEVIRSLLNTAGFERAGSIDEADVVLLNT